jgi:GT2 family glycosyltransferase/glycosyltransferase involved in cell wall biosynthesis
VDVSIVIPVLDKLVFTRQCLDRIWRHTGDSIAYEVIVVDNGSSDGTADWFGAAGFPRPLRYHRNARNLGFAKANNIGAGLAEGRYFLFLNNDTLVQPDWLPEMLRVIRSDQSVGIVGIKQLFPYTSIIYHTGIVFARSGAPEHLYPHLDASLPQVNHEREYQAVNGACLLIERELFSECGGFDEAYVNGYEDVDLCMAARQRGRKVVCCTSAHIYHYAQISEGRTADDDDNAALFARKWKGSLRADRDEYLLRDRFDAGRALSGRQPPRSLANDCIYLADDLGQASALTWVNVELATALSEIGAPVFVNANRISPTVPAIQRKRLAGMAADRPIGGVQIKWSHYWPQHLALELSGDVNLELFVINYTFGRPGSEPWDYWMQCLRQDGREKLAASEFCRAALLQAGVREAECHVLPYGYSREIDEVGPPGRRSGRFRILTVTNSHDLGRYGTLPLLEAYRQAFGAGDAVTLVVKDYGATSGDTTIREWLKRGNGGAPIEYIASFTDKRELIGLYRSCDAFVSAHRGEGFGMKILDAMACGLPVITPLFGGPTSYCTPENCFPVDFSLVPVKDCIDSRSLALTNQPLWAEPDVHDASRQMRRVYESREKGAAVGARGRAAVVDRFSWTQSARALVEIASEVRGRRPKPQRVDRVAPATERSPYWLGLRVSVVVPTHNRKDKLAACLDALAGQSILPQEFEVLVVDDGSTDGTGEAVAARRDPFCLRYFRQDNRGPGAARNLGIERAAGELILFIGDDVIADERLLETHLVAHASRPGAGVAILGHIDWPAAMPRNAVMEYICGDAALQFAYTLIPRLPALDHRFFYTSNISLKREFLVAAADAGVGFDPSFRYAAFEDSELALKLMPRGLEIQYVESARAIHDHAMDLEHFAARERRADQMAVVFYRKHPGQDKYLQVQWLGGLNDEAASLLERPDFLHHLEAFDGQTDALLRALASSLESLAAMDPGVERGAALALSADRVRPALHSVLRVIFDVERTRGKVEEWFAGVDDRPRMRAAQVAATVRRKMELFNADGADIALPGVALPGVALPFASGGRGSSPARSRLMKRVVRRLVGDPRILQRLIAADQLVQNRLRAAGRHTWLARYRRFRERLR